MVISAEELLDLTQKKGIKEAEIYQVKSNSCPVSFNANRLKQVENSQSEGIALRLWQNNQPGLAVAYGEFNPEDLINKALAISALNPVEEIELNQQNKLIYPQQKSTLDLTKLIDLGKQTIAIIREQYPEVICNVDLEWETESTTLINSFGLYCQQSEISYSASIGIEWIKGDDFLGIYEGEYSRELPDLTTAINNLFERLKWAEKNVIIKSGNFPVLFTANAVTMLWEIVTIALNGKRVIDKSSPWHESLGKLIVSPCLTFTQQPNFTPYNCPFDDEGTPTQTLNLIESGYLQNFYSDRTTAKKLNIKPTGNGFRPSLGSYPTADLVNFVVNNGDKSWQKLVESIDYGIIVDQILGDDADISGDFSVNIDLGFLIEKGEIKGRIKDTMISGNIYQSLKQVRDLGNDLTWSGSCYTPSIIIDNLLIVN